jgi:hypothetical protein
MMKNTPGDFAGRQFLYPVPEPASALLAVVGAGLLAVRRRTK